MKRRAATDIAQAWLTTQCDLIPGIERGLVVRRVAADGPLEVSAVWPASDENVKPYLLSTAEQAARTATSTVGDAGSVTGVDGDAANGKFSLVGCPLFDTAGQYGAVALLVRGSASAQRDALLKLLRWGAAWFELLERKAPSQAPSDRLINVVELMASALEHETAAAAATAAANELVTRLNCSRVSIGLLRGRHAQVLAISHSAEVESRTNLVRAISAAMDEAIDQDASVSVPPPPGTPPHVAFAQEVLFERNGQGPICSTPLYHGEQAVGAVTLERPAGAPFSRATIELCETFAALFGPLLTLMAERERPIALKLTDAVGRGLKRLFGPRHFVLKLVALSVVGLVTFLALATGQYRISADATIEGRVKRVVAAPQDGFIASALVRAGDQVEDGQLLATLDARDLELERVKLRSEYEQLVKEQRAAVGARDRATTAIVRAQMKQASAQLDLIEARLTRTQLSAPFSGIVVTGDLSQSLGAPVTHGDVLFEVAPLDAYRVILHVDERDVAAVNERSAGNLALTGLPESTLPVTVKRMLPVSTPGDGGNFFLVEAELGETPPTLRPGMQGVAKIDVGERRLIWIWTHTLIDWMRLTLWRWLG